jgi:predicted NUDIX family phosphoesterase
VSERVLCLPADAITPYFSHGPLATLDSTVRAVQALMSSAAAVFVDRDLAETDESLVQLIPYVVFRSADDRIFCYRRVKGEARLAGQLSLGIGGHVNDTDLLLRNGEFGAYERGLRRELEEEVALNFEVDGAKIDALIHDRSNAVGRVHLGVVHIVDVPLGGLVGLKDESSADGRFRTQADVDLDYHEFETWSQLLLNEVVLP